MSTMLKSEREELRRVVRGDFKALREELVVRHVELIADVEHRVAQRFEPTEQTIREARRKINEIVLEADARVGEIAAECQKECDGYRVEVGRVWVPDLRLVRQKRDEMRRALLADLEARVAHAKARVNRQEIDLLKRLSIDAIASEQAKAFLASIPTVAELVPESRLAELEAQFAGDREAL